MGKRDASTSDATSPKKAKNGAPVTDDVVSQVGMSGLQAHKLTGSRPSPEGHKKASLKAIVLRMGHRSLHGPFVFGPDAAAETSFFTLLVLSGDTAVGPVKRDGTKTEDIEEANVATGSLLTLRKPNFKNAKDQKKKKGDAPPFPSEQVLSLGHKCNVQVSAANVYTGDSGKTFYNFWSMTLFDSGPGGMARLHSQLLPYYESQGLGFARAFGSSPKEEYFLLRTLVDPAPAKCATLDIVAKPTLFEPSSDKIALAINGLALRVRQELNEQSVTTDVSISAGSIAGTLFSVPGASELTHLLAAPFQTGQVDALLLARESFDKTKETANPGGTEASDKFPTVAVDIETVALNYGDYLKKFTRPVTREFAERCVSKDDDRTLDTVPRYPHGFPFIGADHDEDTLSEYNTALSLLPRVNQDYVGVLGTQSIKQLKALLKSDAAVTFYARLSEAMDKEVEADPDTPLDVSDYEALRGANDRLLVLYSTMTE